MTWNDLFDNLVTSEQFSLVLARLAVNSGWAFYPSFVIFVILSIVLVIRKDELAERPWKRLSYWSVGMSFLALLIWGALLVHLHDTETIIRTIHSDATDFWQLSPPLITALLNYLDSAGRLVIFLFVNSIAWSGIALGMLYLKERKQPAPPDGNDENRGDDPPPGANLNNAESENPEETGGNYVFKLRFLESETGAIKEALFDNERWNIGEERTIITDVLFCHLRKDSEIFHITTEELDSHERGERGEIRYDHKTKELIVSDPLLPEDTSTELDNPEEQRKTVVREGNIFSVGGVKFSFVAERKDGTTNTPLTQGPPLSIALIILVTMLVLVQSSSAAGSCVDDEAVCYNAMDGSNPATVSVYQSDKAKTLLIDGELRMSNRMLVNTTDPDFKKHRKLELSLPDKLVELELTRWQLRMPPLHIAILFDLDHQQIYAADKANPLTSGSYGAGSTEAEFWDGIINTILDSFDFSDEGNGDVGSVFASVECDGIAPGSYVYANNTEKDRPGEILTKIGMQNRMKHVIYDCVYNERNTKKPPDISRVISEEDNIDTPPEVVEIGFENIETLLVIVRWHATPADHETVEAFGRSNESGKMLVVDITRNPRKMPEGREYMGQHIRDKLSKSGESQIGFG